MEASVSARVRRVLMYFKCSCCHSCHPLSPGTVPSKSFGMQDEEVSLATLASNLALCKCFITPISNKFARQFMVWKHDQGTASEPPSSPQVQLFCESGQEGVCVQVCSQIKHTALMLLIANPSQGARRSHISRSMVINTLIQNQRQDTRVWYPWCLTDRDGLTRVRRQCVCLTLDIKIKTSPG